MKWLKMLIPTVIIAAPVVHYGMMKDNKYTCIYKETMKKKCNCYNINENRPTEQKTIN